MCADNAELVPSLCYSHQCQGSFVKHTRRVLYWQMSSIHMVLKGGQEMKNVGPGDRFIG